MASSSYTPFDFDDLQEVIEEDQSFDEFYNQSFDDVFNGFEESNYETIPKKRRRHIYRDREGGHVRLMEDYFNPNPRFHDDIFRRRFRMRKSLFLSIVNRINNDVPYFQQRVDATGRKGLSALQKCTAAIRLLAYGGAADMLDEYLCLGESTSYLCLHNFVDAIIYLFGDEYLRRPTTEDLQRLLDIGSARGFPGMLGSIDCMHWKWKNCPHEWKGIYARGSAKPTIVLEAVASQDLWFWHTYFGCPGTLNDLNILDQSPVFNEILEGVAPQLQYFVNGREYKMGYYLADGIYPRWATFIQSISLPQTDKAKEFAKCQESARKDVERAFGVLQARFHIIRHPALGWNQVQIGKIMRACIILHNMIVEDERHTYAQIEEDFQEEDTSSHVNSTFSTNMPTNVGNIRMSQRNKIRNREMHQQLKDDLVEHLWQRHLRRPENN